MKKDFQKWCEDLERRADECSPKPLVEKRTPVPHAKRSSAALSGNCSGRSPRRANASFAPYVNVSANVLQFLIG